MLQLIRNNSPFTVLILFICTLLLKLQVLLHPEVPAVLPDYYLYGRVLKFFGFFFGASAFAWTFSAIILLFCQALYVNAIAVRHRLFYKPTYIPAFCYIMLCSLSPDFGYFSDPLLVNWCLLAGLDVMLMFSQPTHPRTHIFNAGFIFSLAVLLQFPAIFLFLLLAVALLLLRSFNIGEWMVALLGFISPVYFFAGILFLADQLHHFLNWPVLGISLPRQIHNPVYLLGVVSGTIILLACGLYVMQTQMSKSTIYVRRNWGVITAALIILVLVAVFTGLEIDAAWLVVMPAVSLVVAQSLYLEKSKRFSNFIFYFFLLFVIFSQIAFK
ncbi:hypothetical protein ACTHGU_08045 [Chitinophagaceae bacterium MMS25-I14]